MWQLDMLTGVVFLEDTFGGMDGLDAALVNDQAAVLKNFADWDYGQNPFGADNTIDCGWQRHKRLVPGGETARSIPISFGWFRPAARWIFVYGLI
jgi:hypothetical protein